MEFQWRMSLVKSSAAACWLKIVRGMLGLNDEFSRIKNMYCIVLHPRTKFFFSYFLFFIFFCFYIYIYIFIFVLTNAGASCMYICVWV